MMQAGAVLRVARPTDHLTPIAEMYATVLDFAVLAQFEDHDGFDGIILDIPSSPTIWSSRHNADTRLAKLRRKIICWFSTFPITTSGKPVVLVCSLRGFN